MYFLNKNSYSVIAKRIVLVATIFALQIVFAEDVIILKDGVKHVGQITESNTSTVAINVKAGAGTVLMKFPMDKISKVEMEAPAELDSAMIQAPEKRAELLKGLLEKFKGLPASWTVNAMGKLADTYMTLGKDEQAEAIFADIEKLFPNSKFLIKSNIGKAKAALKKGESDKALELLQPLIEEANSTPAPTEENGKIYGEVFLTKGKILEKKDDKEGAIEAYLTVVTAFYQNKEILHEAEAAVEALRKTNPKLTVK